MKIRCLIVDDEKPARELLSQYCKEVPFIEVVAECKNAFETVENLSKRNIDLLFLDIKMPKLNGIQLLKSLNNPPSVIITTAFREYALDGFELDVIDYLKKPFSYDRFLKAVLKVKMWMEKTSDSERQVEKHYSHIPEYMFINSDRSIHKIMLHELKYIAAMGDYSHFFSAKKQTAYISLKKVESMLPEKMFVRVHRSYIVSLKHIDYVMGNTIYIGDDEVPIGKSYRDNFLSRLE